MIKYCCLWESNSDALMSLTLNTLMHYYKGNVDQNVDAKPLFHIFSASINTVFCTLSGWGRFQ